MNHHHQHIFNNLTAALECTRTLDRMGLQISKMDLSGSKPRIVVLNDAKCSQLNAIPRTYIGAGKQYQRCMTTLLDGCQIDYTVRGH